MDLIMYEPKHTSSRVYRPEVYEKPNSFLSAVLCILAIFTTLVFIILLALRAGNIGYIIRNAEIDFSGIMNDTEMSHYIVNQINGLDFHDSEVNFYDIEEFLMTDAVSDELGVVIGGFAKAFTEGNLDHHLTVDDIADIAKSLEPELEDLFGHKITEEQYLHIAETLDDIVDFSSYTVGGIMEDVVEVDMAIPFIFFSPYLLWGTGILCILLLLIIFFRRRAYIADALLAVGIPIIIPGSICLLLAFYAGSYPQTFGETFVSLSRFLSGPIQLVMQYGLSFAIAGAAIILISLVFRFISPKVRH